MGISGEGATKKRPTNPRKLSKKGRDNEGIPSSNGIQELFHGQEIRRSQPG